MTTKDGGFDLQSLPPGDYTVEAWHEALGRMKQKITVRSGQATALDLVFKAPGHSGRKNRVALTNSMWRRDMDPLIGVFSSRSEAEATVLELLNQNVPKAAVLCLTEIDHERTSSMKTMGRFIGAFVGFGTGFSMGGCCKPGAGSQRNLAPASGWIWCCQPYVFAVCLTGRRFVPHSCIISVQVEEHRDRSIESGFQLSTGVVERR